MFNKSIANKMPVWVETPLHYVPTALLTAIIVPEVLINEGTINFSIFENLRIMAACFAVFIALISRNSRGSLPQEGLHPKIHPPGSLDQHDADPDRGSAATEHAGDGTQGGTPPIQS